MRPATATPPDRYRFAQVALAYQTAGYEVQVQPSPDDLPDFLGGFQPDILAHGNGETIVVEVKKRSELDRVPLDNPLEAALQNRPGWRFEMVIDRREPEPGQALSAAQIRTSLNEVEELQRGGHLIAALLLLWSAAEGALRLLAEIEAVELESSSTEYLLTRLYTLGMLGRDQYWILDGTERLRKQATHGYHVSLTQDDLSRVSAVAYELLNEVEAVAA